MRLLVFVVALFLAAPAMAQRGLHRVWETHLDGGSPIWALGFSPDHTKLAVGMGDYDAGKVRAGRVVVISIDQPKRTLSQTPYQPLYLSAVSWSAESEYVIVWDSADTWRVDKRTEETRRDASISCRTEGKATRTLVCKNLASGEETRLRGVTVHGPFSLGGGRVAVSELKPHHRSRWVAQTFDASAFTMSYKRRLIWDIASNRVLASWVPEKQEIHQGAIRAAFALSSDGTLLAEGQSGIVRLYRVTPR